MTRISTVDEAVDLLSRHGLELAGVEPIVVIALSEDLGRSRRAAARQRARSRRHLGARPSSGRRPGRRPIVARAPGRLAGVPVAAYVLALVCAEAGPLRSRY